MKTLAITVILLSISFTLSSQSIKIDSNGDTIICFNLNESKFLMKTINSAHYFRIQDSLCEAQNSLKDSVITHDKIIQNGFSMLVKNKDEIISLEQYKVTKLTEQSKKDTRAIRRQKLYKWVAISAGSILSGYLALRTVFH